jgi:hypothetical protein
MFTFKKYVTLKEHIDYPIPVLDGEREIYGSCSDDYYSKGNIKRVVNIKLWDYYHSLVQIVNNIRESISFITPNRLEFIEHINKHLQRLENGVKYHYSFKLQYDWLKETSDALLETIPPNTLGNYCYYTLDAMHYISFDVDVAAERGKQIKNHLNAQDISGLEDLL